MTETGTALQLIRNADFRSVDEKGHPADWAVWEPDWKPAACTIRAAPEGLLLAGKDAFAVGGIKQTVSDIHPGQSYTVRATLRLEGVAHPTQSVRLRIHWIKEGKHQHTAGILVRGPIQHNESWQFEDVLTAPKGVDGAELILEVRWPRGGSLICREITLRPSDPPEVRSARIGTVYLRPADTTPDQNVDLYCEQIDEAGRLGLDILCLPEMLTFIGTWGKFGDSAQEIPGRFTEKLGAAAKRNNIWLVAGLIEKAGERLYNTAALINREGELAGTYRKVHIPSGEWHNGIAPGAEYPVFHTEFGIIGIQICYDGFFGENTRALALSGAEIIFAPTWGTTSDDQDGRVEGKNIFRVRARDNGVYMVPCVYDGDSLVIDPQGRILASSEGESGVFWAEAELTRRERFPYIGNWRTVMARDRMPHTYGPLLES